MSYIKYDNEKIYINDEQSRKISETLTNPNKPTHITVGNRTLKTIKIEILEEEKCHNNKVEIVMGNDEEWQREQLELKQQSVEEKTEREWACRFVTFYLVNKGYKETLGLDWRTLSHSERQKRFNLTIPVEIFEKFRQCVEEYHKTHNEAWCEGKVYKHLLPKNNQNNLISEHKIEDPPTQ